MEEQQIGRILEILRRKILQKYSNFLVKSQETLGRLRTTCAVHHIWICMSAALLVSFLLLVHSRFAEFWSKSGPALSCASLCKCFWLRGGANATCCWCNSVLAGWLAQWLRTENDPLAVTVVPPWQKVRELPFIRRMELDKERLEIVRGEVSFGRNLVIYHFSN